MSSPIELEQKRSESAASLERTRKIALAKPYFDGSELPLIQEALASGWVTQGPKIAQFETEVAALVGASQAVASSNCTTAMHLAWLVLGIGPGDDVICPSYSFIASANAIMHAGATPVFADIDKDTLNLDVQSVRKCIADNYDGQLQNKKSGNKLKAVLIVHQIGIPCDIDEFQKLCKEYGLILMEDAACAIGSSYKGTMIGGSGNICAFSFHPRKVISTGEGGMLTLNGETLANKARVYRAHGMSVSDLERHKSGSTTFESYEVVGYNYRMTDVQAAIGIRQLTLLDWILKKRNEIAARFDEAFAAVDRLLPVKTPAYVSAWNRQSYHLRIDNASADTRNAFMTYLELKGISTRRGIPPIHKEPVYNCGLSLPVTEAVSESSFFIPIYPQLDESEIEQIIEAVLSGSKEIL